MILASVSTTLAIGASVAAIIGLVGGLGGTWAIFRARGIETTLELQQINISAYKDRLEEVERTEAEKDEVIKIQDSRLTKQGDEIVVLRNMVQGVTAIQRLSDRIDKHFEELLEAVKVR